MAGTGNSIANVNSDEMRTLAVNIEGKIDEWDQAVINLYRIVADMDAMWDGDANRDFNDRWHLEDRPKYDRLSAEMKEYKNAIITAAKAYDDAESDAQGIVKKH